MFREGRLLEAEVVNDGDVSCRALSGFGGGSVFGRAELGDRGWEPTDLEPRSQGGNVRPFELPV